MSNTYTNGKGIIRFDSAVTSVGNNAFYNVRRLDSINLPTTVASIGGPAFYLNPLNAIRIPDSVTSISDNAFSSTNIHNFYIPSSVTSITSLFCTHGRTQKIVVDPNNTKYDSRGNCNAVIETASNTLVCGCNNTFIPDSVTTIRSYAFAFGINKPTIIIPNSVRRIEGYVFYHIIELTTIVIPNSVTFIGLYTFNGCTGLTSVTCLATTPPELGSNVFGDTNNCPIYVPAVSVDAYKSASGWSNYASRIQPIYVYSFN